MRLSGYSTLTGARAGRAALACLSLAGCGVRAAPPRAQVVVHVDTDLDVPRLADTLRLELLVPDADGRLQPCTPGCPARAVHLGAAGADGGVGAALPLSFGVTPPLSEGAVYLHATLYPGDRLTSRSPSPENAVESLALLSFGEAVHHVQVLLEGACAGQPSELRRDGRTCAAGRLGPIPEASAWDEATPPRAGSFRAAYGRPCAGEPRGSVDAHDAEVCMPGGTYWMGDWRLLGLGQWRDPVPEHLVTISPFYLDRDEYTVARYRRLLAEGLAPSQRPAVRAGTPGVDLSTLCNYTPEAGVGDANLEDYPLNCVTWQLARAICEAEGRRLPTEAEWEWAAGNREEETLEPQGDTDMNFTRAIEICADHVPVGYPWTSCTRRVEDTAPLCGPGPMGCAPENVEREHTELDRTLDDIFDMTYNVSEWTADLYELYAEPFWTPGAYGPDPRLDLDTLPEDQPVHGRVVKGGDVGPDGYYGNMSARRRPQPARAATPATGFRCARDAR